jgi:hypothetical protein
MATEREFQEAVTRCIAIMAAYHDAGQGVQTAGEAVVGVQGVAGHVRGFHLEVDALDAHILHPVESELLARYGPEETNRIYGTFLKAFEEGYIFNRREAD